MENVAAEYGYDRRCFPDDPISTIGSFVFLIFSVLMWMGVCIVGGMEALKKAEAKSLIEIVESRIQKSDHRRNTTTLSSNDNPNQIVLQYTPGNIETNDIDIIINQDEKDYVNHSNDELQVDENEPGLQIDFYTDHKQEYVHGMKNDIVNDLLLEEDVKQEGKQYITEDKGKDETQDNFELVKMTFASTSTIGGNDTPGEEQSVVTGHRFIPNKVRSGSDMYDCKNIDTEGDYPDMTRLVRCFFAFFHSCVVMLC